MIEPAPPYVGESQHVAVRAAALRLAASRDGVLVLGTAGQRTPPSVTSIVVSTTHTLVDGLRCRAASIRIRPPSAPEIAQDVRWLTDGLRAAGWRVDAGNDEWAVVGPGAEDYVRQKAARRESAAAARLAEMAELDERNADLERLAPLLGGRFVRLTPGTPAHIVFDYEAASGLAERLQIR